ncbi:MAG: hypothetical protein DRN68_08600, partial [Thaumarchaeota archaeon]
MKGGTVDAVALIRRYLDQADWRVRENANIGFSAQGLNLYLSGSAIEEFWLSEIYPQELAEAHRRGYVHIHDLRGPLCPYCVGWDLADLLIKGFGGVPGRVESKPPKHLSTALLQLVNFLFTLQQEAAGAVAVSNWDTLLAPFVREDGLSYHQVKQAVQEFVFNMNVPTRVGAQPPFSNLTLDITPPPGLAKLPAMVGGKPMSYTYGELQEEARMLVRAFFEVMCEGDAKGRPFTFPIPTIDINHEFPWDDPALKPMWEATAKYGIPYFANFLTTGRERDEIRSMCPLAPSTKVWVKNKYGRPELIEIGKLGQAHNGEYEVLSRGRWLKGRFVRVPTKEVVRVKLYNGIEIEMNPDHLNVTRRGIVPARDLHEGDYLPFDKAGLPDSGLGS